MKNITLITFLILSSLLFTSSSVFSKEHDNSEIIVKGITTNSGINSNYEKLENVTINIYNFNAKLTSYNTDQNGKFDFTIPANTYIIIEFIKDDFVAKRILFDTRNGSSTSKTKPFDLEIVMLDYVEGIDYSELDFPITIVGYNKGSDDYYYAYKYTKDMMNTQHEIISEMEGK